MQGVYLLFHIFFLLCISNPLDQGHLYVLDLQFTSIPAALDALIVGGIRLLDAVRAVGIHEGDLGRAVNDDEVGENFTSLVGFSPQAALRPVCSLEVFMMVRL